MSATISVQFVAMDPNTDVSLSTWKAFCSVECLILSSHPVRCRVTMTIVKSWFLSFGSLLLLVVTISSRSVEAFSIMSATIAKQAVSSTSRLFSSTQNQTLLATTSTATSTDSPIIAANQRIMTKQNYSERQLKDALESLLEGSSNTAHDGTHIYGYGDESHTLSMLQTITATRILDYTAYMVR